MKIFLIILLSTLSLGLQAQPPDDPIDPAEFQSGMGTGFDVAWAQFPAMLNDYNEQAIIDYASEGFKNARIRSHFDMSPELLVHFDSIVTHCLRHGITPVIAYESKEAEENPTRENMRKVVEWWRELALYFKDHSHKLAFNLFIEVGHALGDLPYDTLNMWYDSIVPAIRETNPTRILIFAPRGQWPENLMGLRFPEPTGNYFMAEWHDYASGPTQNMDISQLHKRWTTGTEIEREQIRISIDNANQWSAVSGKPTWMGAWMAGKINDPGYYDPEIEVVFAVHMVKEFRNYDMPWSTNAHQHYYDVVTNQWIPEKSLYMLALKGFYQEERNVLKLYGSENYEGILKKVEIGYYDHDFLDACGFSTGFKSMELPPGFVLETFSESSFKGTMNYYLESLNTFDNAPINSFRFRDIRFTDYEAPSSIENSKIKNIAIYPNPFYDGFTISSGKDLEKGLLKIYDGSGRLIEDQVINNSLYFSFPQLQQGMYFLEIQKEGNIYREKIIKIVHE